MMQQGQGRSSPMYRLTCCQGMTIRPRLENHRRQRLFHAVVIVLHIYSDQVERTMIALVPVYDRAHEEVEVLKVLLDSLTTVMIVGEGV